MLIFCLILTFWQLGVITRRIRRRLFEEHGLGSKKETSQSMINNSLSPCPVSQAGLIDRGSIQNGNQGERSQERRGIGSNAIGCSSKGWPHGGLCSKSHG